MSEQQPDSADRLRAIIHQAQSTVSRSEVERLAEALETPHVDAVKYAREQVVPLYRLDEDGTPYERGMIRQVAAHWLAGYFTARPAVEDGATDPARFTPAAEGKAIGSADPSASLSSCARSEAQRIREILEWLPDYLRGMRTCQEPKPCSRCIEASAFISDQVAWLLQRSEEAREAYETLLNGYQELNAAVTTSDLDHASVVLIAKANAQDSEIVEAVKASAEEARETQEQARVERLVLEAEAINAKVQQKYAAQLREQQERAEQAESALAAARQELTELRRAIAPNELVFSSLSQQHFLNLIAAYRAEHDLAAARLRATPQDEWLERKAATEEGHDVTAGSESEFRATPNKE